jgi:hypothetical protein
MRYQGTGKEDRHWSRTRNLKLAPLGLIYFEDRSRDSMA